LSSIRLQEIMTRAVVGRCDRRVVWTHTAPADGADCVLGVHVSSPELTVEQDAAGHQVHLSAVCEVWCSAGDETRVERIVCTHTEPANVPLVARVVGETETTGRLLRGARCLEAEVREGLFHLTLEMHIALEAVGVARLWVKAFDLLEDAAEYESMDSDTSDDSSQSQEEVNAEWEPEPEFEPWAEQEEAEDPVAGLETEAETEAGIEFDLETEAETAPDTGAETAPEAEKAEPAAEPEARPEAGVRYRPDMAAVASVPERDPRRRSTAVARFRGPTHARISIVQ